MERLIGICVPQMRGFNKLEKGPTTYVVSFPRVMPSVRCPVLCCLAVSLLISLQCKIVEASGDSCAKSDFTRLWAIYMQYSRGPPGTYLSG